MSRSLGASTKAKRQNRFLPEQRSAGRIKPYSRVGSEIGKPVVTSCQSYIWYALELAHVKEKISGYGRLMETLAE